MGAIGGGRRLVLAVAVLLALAVACGQAGDDGQQAADPTTPAGQDGDGDQDGQEEPAPGGEPAGDVTIAFHDFGVEQLDPSVSTAIAYWGGLYDYLVGATGDGELSLDYGVLESIETEDGRVYTMVLKDGITWHDGEPLTVEDVAFTMEYFGREGTSCNSCGLLQANLEYAEVIDDRTVEVALKNADVTFLDVLGPVEGDVVVVPKHYIDEVGSDGFSENPIGTGPFKFSSRGIGEYVEYEANEDYWNDERRAGFQTLRIVLVPEASTRVAMLETGEADVASLRPEDVGGLRDKGFTIDGPRNAGMPWIVFFRSFDEEFLTNRLEFRKALALAVDWDEIVASFYPDGTGERYAGGAPLFNELTLGYDPSLQPYEYDPEEAQRLLEESGYDGERVEFGNYFFHTNPEQLEVNEAIATYWRNAGVNVDLVNIDWGAQFQRIVADPPEFDPPAPLGAQFAYARPSVVSNLRIQLGGPDIGGVLRAYWDPDGMAALYNELITIIDRDERDERLREINRQLYEEYFGLPIATRHLAFGLGERVGAWEPTDGTPGVFNWSTLRPAP